MHIGTARTALFNWLFAKHHGGKMLFRIEDTDRKRHSEEAVVKLVQDMEWLDLDWDGEIVSQYESRERHAAVAHELVEKGHAYYCYCSPEELEAMREKAKAEGAATFYDRRWRDKDASEAPEGIKPVIRIKAPIHDGVTVIKDQVQGEIKVNNEQLDDFIILRSDGTPTYMLSVVVDDHDMGVTHIIRGDDHINNAFRQKLIFEAMGWDVPEYAHLPLILGPDGAKMSKRHGAASVGEYKDMGYLPEAVCNYLMRLGWSHGDDEIFSREQAIEWFSLEGVNKSAPRFDFAKLENINAHYMSETDNETLVELILPLLNEKYGILPNDTHLNRLNAGMDELKNRAKTLLQLAEESKFYAFSDEYSFDEKATQILDDDALMILAKVQDKLDSEPEFVSENIQMACKDVADEMAGGKLGKIGMPLRAALTGSGVSPSIFHAAEILGREETLRRLQYTLEKFGKKTAA
jgi:glutamyl-tRNA synthetase